MVAFLIFLGVRAIRWVCCRSGYNEPTSHPAGNGLIGPTIFSDGPDFLNNFSEKKSIFWEGCHFLGPNWFRTKKVVNPCHFFINTKISEMTSERLVIFMGPILFCTRPVNPVLSNTNLGNESYHLFFNMKISEMTCVRKDSCSKRLAILLGPTDFVLGQWIQNQTALLGTNSSGKFL